MVVGCLVGRTRLVVCVTFIYVLTRCLDPVLAGDAIVRDTITSDTVAQGCWCFRIRTMPDSCRCSEGGETSEA